MAPGSDDEKMQGRVSGTKSPDEILTAFPA